MGDLAGKTIKSYRLDELIGAGNFAAVYSARQSVVERDVAIKVIWPVLANHPEFVRHFEVEAQLVAGLEHPHIVPLYDFWRDSDGAYIVMRLIRGGHLADALATTPMSVVDSVNLLDQIASALMLAHRSGVIHRDIKPENILLDETGNSYLTDFGIAQILSVVQEHNGTFEGMGSLAYAAPEQIAGNTVTPQSDQYSLAIVLYEMLVGEHPFPQLAQLSESELRNFRLKSALPSIREKRPEFSIGMDNVLQRATNLSPHKRFPDVLTFAAAFRAAVNRGGAGKSAASIIQNTHDPKTIPNPYKGLRPFQQTDVNHFFGRQLLIQRMVARLREMGKASSRFLAIVGPSGSGKSSVVKAGLIPVLRRGGVPTSKNWFFVEMVPGAGPITELTNALRRISSRPTEEWLELVRGTTEGLHVALDKILPDEKSELFLFVDQFEEVFTLCEDEAKRKHFFAALAYAVASPASRLRLVITLRADFYDRPLLYPQIGQLLSERSEVVIPLTEPELEQAIIEPARVVGIEIESGLVAAIIADIKEQPGALPLLQYCLSEIFQRRTGDQITTAAYHAIGGVRGALARRAEEIYYDLLPQQQEMVQQILLRLVTLGEGVEDTRRRTPLTEIDRLPYETANLVALINDLGRARLLMFDHDPDSRTPTVEIAHEALIREWQRLRTWLDENRHDVRMQRGLTSLSKEWEGAEYDPSFLLKGSRLHQYEEWFVQSALILTQQEQHYLQASIAEREQQIAAEKSRQERERQLERQALNRLRMAAVLLLVGVVVALGLTAFALSESENAQRERDRSESARATSDANASVSRSLALSANAERAMSAGDSDLAVVLALESIRTVNPVPQAQRTLAEVALAIGTRHRFTGHTSHVVGVAISPDNRTVASASLDFSVRLWDTQTGTELHMLTGHNGDVHAVVFSPDGMMVLSGAADFKAILWDVETGTEIRRFEGHTRPIWGVDISPDGRYVLTSSGDHTVILWDIATGDEIRRLEGHAAWVTTAKFTPDGHYVLSSGRDAMLWDVETGELIQRFRSESSNTAIALSYVGDVIATGDTTGGIIIWHLASGNILQRLRGESNEITSIAFHPDGKTIWAGTVLGEILVWEIDTGQLVRRLSGHGDAVLSIVISDNGQWLVSGSVDQTVRFWQIGSPEKLAAFAGFEDRITGIDYDTRDYVVFASSMDGSLTWWDINTGNILGRMSASVPITGFDVDTESDHALVGLRDGRVELWDTANMRILHSFEGHDGIVTSIAFSTDKSMAISSSRDGSIMVWDLETMSARQHFSGHEGIRAVAFVPNTQMIVSAGQDGQVILWDILTGELLNYLKDHGEAIYAIDVSSDGQYIISGSRDSYVTLWDVKTTTEIRRFAGHTAPVWDVEFSPDRNLVISGAADSTIIVWDLNNGSELQRFQTEDIPFELAFVPDGRRVISGGGSGDLTLWQTFSLDELLLWTRYNRYLRELTCIEHELYQVPPYCSG